jgi:N-acetylornithine carbamoyltransferase
MTRHFIKTTDLSPAEFEEMIDSALRFKNKEFKAKSLDGKSVGLVFFNPSLRTRASMQVGIHELGGNSVILEPGDTSWTIEHRDGAIMDSDKTEHASEFVRVLGRYVSAIGVRSFAGMKDWDEDRSEPMISSFIKHSEKPIINLESAMHHPCQAMADMMTIRERKGSGKKKVLLTWAYHPKPLPMAVPNSFGLAAAQMGHDLVIAHPSGYELDDALMDEVREAAANTGGSVTLTDKLSDAYDGAEVVYAKSWGAKQFYGEPEKDIENRARFRKDWVVDAPKMATGNDAIFMHCLPVRRNVIVTDEVIDSKSSVVIDQAENRLHVQKAILTKFIK